MGHERILVVGATGRIGAQLAGDLVRRGFAVRGLVRDPTRAKAACDPSLEIVPGDLRSPDAVAAALDGCSRVVFAAGVNGQAGRGTAREVEFEGVARLARASAAARVRRLVLLSSAGVTQREHPHNCTFDSVLKWKRLGEEAVRASGVAYVIVRALGLRDRPAGVQGVRLVQGDRIAFGQDIARGDVAAVLADALRPCPGDGFAAQATRESLVGASLEIFNAPDLTGGCWAHEAGALVCVGATGEWA